MEVSKFKNDVFNFDLVLYIFDSDSKKDLKKLHKVWVNLGYKKDQFNDWINSTNAFVIGGKGKSIIAFNNNAHKDKKDRSIRLICTLQHECNHVKENILDDISEVQTMRETECAMRISDWCFKKCMSSDFFSNLLK